MLKQHGLITEPAYQIEELAEKPGPLLTSCGLRIIADRAYSEVTDGIDTLFIAGAPDVNAIFVRSHVGGLGSDRVPAR
jgi:hypothetical protein